MTNQIEIDDIKSKIGELVIENMVLQKEVIRLRAELEQIKAKLVTDEEETKKPTTW